MIWGLEERCGVEAEGCGCGESWGHKEQGSGRRVKEARGVGSGPIRVCIFVGLWGGVESWWSWVCDEGRVEGPMEAAMEDVFDF
jgi:hypothetical protein